MKMQLGVKVRDKITGFEGVVTARVEYLGGSPYALVECVNAGGKYEDHWFEGQRLDVTGRAKAKKARKR